jgi:hypothetical protein
MIIRHLLFPRNNENMMKLLMLTVPVLLASLFCACSLDTRTKNSSITNFTDGDGGWTNDGIIWKVEKQNGNPNEHLHGDSIRPGIDSFGYRITNDSNSGFIGDLTRYGKFKISIDIKIISQMFFLREVPRNLIVELRDYDQPNGNYGYTSVWYKLGEVSKERNKTWTTYSVTIENPFLDSLPAGWGVYGDENDENIPVFPTGRTFHNVLQGIDEISFSTFEPGYFYGDTFFFNIRFDNIKFQSVD